MSESLNPTNKYRILVVEDEPHIAFHIEHNLVCEGYEVVMAGNGLIAIEQFENAGPFALVILDVMLPEINGFQVAERIRSVDSTTAILFLTARAGEKDRIKGLEIGADDYITKPFHLKELILKVNRMVKRAELLVSSASSELKNPDVILNGNIKLNMESLELQIGKRTILLTELESKLLTEFIKHPDRVLSREYLLEKVWGIKGSVETRSVDNFILRLRKILEEDPSQPRFIESVRGKGYRMNRSESRNDDISV